jgi:hypothetical protein
LAMNQQWIHNLAKKRTQPSCGFGKTCIFDCILSISKSQRGLNKSLQLSHRRQHTVYNIRSDIITNK